MESHGKKLPKNLTQQQRSENSCEAFSVHTRTDPEGASSVSRNKESFIYSTRLGTASYLHEELHEECITCVQHLVNVPVSSEVLHVGIFGTQCCNPN